MGKVRTVKYLHQDELAKLLGCIASKRDKAMFLLAYRHGLRVSEVGMLRPEDIDLSRGRIRIERLKNSQGGEHPMQPDEMRILRAWMKERPSTNPYLFAGIITELPISRQSLNLLMKHYCQKAGIPADKSHFHVLKHSIATHLLDAGADIRFVQDWIGHKNIQNTVIYAHLSHKARDETARRVFATPSIVSV